MDVMLIDLQITNYSSPSTDLNYLLYTSTTGEVRRPNLDDFLSTYYNSFSSVLEAANLDLPFTQAELRQDFKEKNVHGAIFSMVLLPFVIMDPEHVMDLQTGTDEDLNDMLQEMKEKTMSQWDNNSVMKPRFLAMFDDMIESGVIP